MQVISVQGAVGGIGASTLAWALARERGGFAFETGGHAGGLAWAAGVDAATTAWPSVAPRASARQVLTHAAEAEGCRLLSGGAVPRNVEATIAAAAQSSAVVVDGPCTLPYAVRILLATNDERVWQQADCVPADLVVVRCVFGGLPFAQLRAEDHRPLLRTRSDFAVRRAARLGIGVPRGGPLQHIVEQVWKWVDGEATEY